MNPRVSLRWSEERSQYYKVVKHCKEAKHGNADALSRIPDPTVPCSVYEADIQPADLPLGGCSDCTKVYK